jgi:hypothetical protein
MTDHRPIRGAGETTLLAPAQPGYRRLLVAIAASFAFVDLGVRCCSSPPAISAHSATGWALRLTRFVHGTVEQ